MSRIPRAISKVINKIHGIESKPLDKTQYSVDSASGSIGDLKKLTEKENSRVMDSTTFNELLDADEIGLILADGGTNLTKQQLQMVKARAQEMSNEALQNKQYQVASQPGYREYMLNEAQANLLPSAMGYTEAEKIRKRGFGSLLTSKLANDQSISQAIGSSISERTQATMTGFKQKFDPLNIVKKVTGGSKLATALYGNLAGRSKEDISFFAGDNKKLKLEPGEVPNTAVELLGGIFELLMKAEAARSLEAEERKSRAEEDELEEDFRNSQIIAALTGKKITKRKVKKTKKEKEEPKKTEKKSKKAGIGKISTASTISKVITTAGKGIVSTVSKIGPGAAILGGATILGGTALTLSQAVGAAEAGGSYEVAYGDREDPKTGKVRNIMGLKTAEEFSGKKLSEMTLEEIKKFQEYRNKEKKNTGAVGKYQFVGTTLFGTKDRPGLVQRLGLPMDTKFTPEIQDKLNEVLFQDNVKILQQKGVPLTPGNLYMAHYIGAGGAAAVYEAVKRGEDVTVAQALVNARLPDPSVQNRELTEIKVKDFEGILQSRLEKKGFKVSQELPIIKGQELDKISKENIDAKKKQAEQAAIQKKVNNTTVTTNSEESSEIIKEDDTNPYLKKMRKAK